MSLRIVTIHVLIEDHGDVLLGGFFDGMNDMLDSWIPGTDKVEILDWCYDNTHPDGVNIPESTIDGNGSFSSTIPNYKLFP